MIKLVVKALIGALGLYLASRFAPGVTIDTATTLIIAAVVLGLVNAIIRPVLILLTLPLTLITLGLFLLVINAATFALTAYLLHGFAVAGPAAALVGSLIVGLTSWVGHILVGQGGR